MAASVGPSPTSGMNNYALAKFQLDTSRTGMKLPTLPVLLDNLAKPPSDLPGEAVRAEPAPHARPARARLSRRGQPGVAGGPHTEGEGGRCGAKPLARWYFFAWAAAR